MAGISGIYDHIIQIYMQDLDYHSCITCSKSWISSHMKEQRIKFSRKTLPLRPNPANWKNVRFLDEVHFDLGP